MRSLSLTGYVCLMAASQAVAAISAVGEPAGLTIRLYDSAGVGERELRQAAEEAVWIFRKANLSVAWVQCELNVKDLPAGSPCRETPNSFGVGLLNQAPGFLSKGALGFALISSGPLRHSGVVYPRVAELARSDAKRVQTYQVLAYAIAHEVAHLILGSTAHGPSGILRKEYAPAELQAMSQRRLLFSSREAAEMRRRLAEWSHADAARQWSPVDAGSIATRFGRLGTSGLMLSKRAARDFLPHGQSLFSN